MQEIKKGLRLNSIDYYQTHLSLINCILPRDVRMTPKEIEVLGIFMSFEGELAIHRFGPTARKLVMQEAKISPAGLSNYITSLKSKGILEEAGDIIRIHQLLQVEKQEQFYRFRLQKITNEQEN